MKILISSLLYRLVVCQCVLFCLVKHAGAGDERVISDFVAKKRDTNHLQVVAAWNTQLPATSRVEYKELEDTVWQSTIESTAQTMDHEVVIVGLKAATCYVFRPVSHGVTGLEKTVTLGKLPSSFPSTELVVTRQYAEGGVTVTNITDSVVAVNDKGEILWYHTDTEGLDVASFQQLEGDGRLLYNTMESIKAIDYMGNEEVLLDISAYGEVSHHSFAVTEDNNFMYLSRVSHAVSTSKKICADEIIERDMQGNQVWRWNSADHADELGGFVSSNRLQLEVIAKCGHDWTHANSIFPYTEADGKKYVLLSTRNLHRIIKIDYSSGKIVWQLGSGLDFSYAGSEEQELQWFFHQHSVKRLANGSIMLFDNGVGRNGNVHHSDFSRAVIYNIDEINMAAKITWKYDFDTYAPYAGNVLKLSSGNILTTFPVHKNDTYPTLVELDESGEVVWQTDFLFAGSSFSESLFSNYRIASLYALRTTLPDSSPLQRSSIVTTICSTLLL